MQWIEDIAHEYRGLDRTPAKLRRFGFTVGAVAVGAGALLVVSGSHGVLSMLLGISGAILIACAWARLPILKRLYNVWMAIAVIGGWISSRCILTALFLFLVVPLGLLSRIFRVRFLDLRFDRSGTTYWIPRSGKTSDYRKMS
jgi:hypothetical protein